MTQAHGTSPGFIYTASIKGFAARLPSLTIDLKGNRTRQVTLTVTDNSGSSTSVTQMVQLL